MKRLTVIPMLLALLACRLFTPAPPATATLSPLPISPTETLMAVCTPPACNANETYGCPGNCPGGCGTVCATVTPDAALAPITTVEGAGEWIVRAEEQLVIFDPSGVQPSAALQRIYAPVFDFVLVRDGNIYSLTDTGNGSLDLRQVYPRERLIGDLDTRRGVEGSPRAAPIFSSDGASLVWSRAESAESLARAVFVTSLETGESREIWRTELPSDAMGHAIVPLFYDDERQQLVYALHTFYSGMTLTQVASLYIADIAADKITPLWTLNPAEMYAGVSAAVSPDGRLLAYLTWGEPQADFTLPWTLHVRDLSNGDETIHRLTETWNNAEVHLISPDGNKVLFTVSRYDANNEYQTEMFVFNLQDQTWNSIYAVDYDAKPYFSPRAWSDGDWLILTTDTDYSTWVMRPDGTALTQITPLKWVGLLDE
ncbi:MAG: hypothetical protein HS124_11200 [Anaerolineales bacterium]|nr:hypothetical protein [Anaerolineales bacterium]MCL4260856.1 hypothetical protein [Anaerolineales bacterium]